MSSTARVLLDNEAICKAMSRAAKDAVSVRVLSAWATMGAGLECLSACGAARKEAIIGACFAVTDPGALHELIRRGFHLRVVDQLRSGGTFHPKVYLFERPDGAWTALLGSANLTDAAFTRNAEAMVELSLSTEAASDLNGYFSEHWESARPGELTDAWFDRYRKRYEDAAAGLPRDIARAERPGGPGRRTDAPRPSQLLGLMESDWAGYLRRLERRRDRRDLDGATNSYLATLSEAHRVLESGLADAQRSDIGCVMGRRDAFGWLGRISLVSGPGAKVYSNRSLRARIDRLLQPLLDSDGEEEPLAAAERAFAGLRRITGFGPGFITRMLTLARPDRFCSLNAASEGGLASLVGIPKTRLREWDGYQQGLRIIYDTPWYKSPKPDDEKMRKLWDARVALVDAYVYEPPG